MPSKKGGSTLVAVLRFDKLTVPRKIEGETVGYLKGRFFLLQRGLFPTSRRLRLKRNFLSLTLHFMFGELPADKVKIHNSMNSRKIIGIAGNEIGSDFPRRHSNENVEMNLLCLTIIIPSFAH